MMSFLMAISTILVASTSSLTVDVKNLRTNEPASDGSFDFDYFHGQTQSVAEDLKKFYTNAESETNGFIKSLKTSNEPLAVLDDYENAVSLVAGTRCEIPKEDKNEFNGAQESIETTVEICAGSFPKDDFDTLNKTVTERLAKVQAIDNTIRLNSQICSSLRVLPAPNCKKTENEALAKLGNILTQEEITKLTDLSEQASEGAKRILEWCVNDGTKSLVERLNESINTISDCSLNQ